MSASAKRPILVSAGSKHGSTTGIAEHIGVRLRERGLDVVIAAPDEADPAGYAFIILGSAVYAGHWLNEAKDLATKVAKSAGAPSVWLFSSGPVGDPPKPDEDPVDVVSIMEMTGALGHRLFAGKLDKSKLGFGERAIVTALRAPEGDFRDWGAISAWADDIASVVSAGTD